MSITIEWRQATDLAAPVCPPSAATTSLLSAEDETALAEIRATVRARVVSAPPVSTPGRWFRRIRRQLGRPLWLTWPTRILLALSMSAAIQLGWMVSEVRHG